MTPPRWTVLSGTLFGLMVFAWAGNYLFVRVGEAYVAPLWLATLRASVGAAGIGAFLALRRHEGSFSWADRRDAMLLGLPNTALFLGLWFVAATAIPPGQTAVIVYTFPLWVALVSPLILGGRPGALQWITLAVGFGGVILVSQPWASGTARPPTWAIAELLLAAVSWAAATVAFQRRFPPSSLSRANGYQLLGGAAALALVTLCLRPGVTDASSPTLWISVAWLGLFGTAFAYGVWFYLMEKVHASVLSTYSFLVPLTALALSVVFEAERLTAPQVLGVALVLCGIYLVGRTHVPHPYENGGPVAPRQTG